MPEISKISYSREATIVALRDYYQFLIKMYLPDSAIIEPPAEGWPSITTDTMRPQGKTNEVVELLRHLPYIRNTAFELQGAAYTQFADWQFYSTGPVLRNNLGDDIRVVTEGLEYANTPAHVVGLTYGGHNNPVFLLDTRLGIVHCIE